MNCPLPYDIFFRLFISLIQRVAYFLIILDHSIRGFIDLLTPPSLVPNWPGSPPFLRTVSKRPPFEAGVYHAYRGKSLSTEIRTFSEAGYISWYADGEDNEIGLHETRESGGSFSDSQSR